MRKIRLVFEYFAMVAMALALALTYEIFVFENAFAPSGTSGIATMIQYIFDFNAGYVSLMINIPLSIIAIKLIDKNFAYKSTVFVIVFSVALVLLDYIDLSPFIYRTENGTSTILAPIAAGVINGAIYGTCIRLGASTGGIDIVGAIIRTKKPHISLVWIIFALNVAIAGVSYFVYGFNAEPVILCILFSYLTSAVSDFMLKGLKEALKFEVITDEAYAEEIGERLISEMKHGVTVMNAEGFYSKKNKRVLVCVINKHQISAFQKIVYEYPNTFAYVTSVSETVGNFTKVSK